VMNLIIKPLITEKASSVNNKGIYTFLVSKKSNKIEIRKEIERIYGVSVVDINTMVCAPKPIVKYTKKRVMRGKKLSYKKAIATLKSGEVIDFYGGV
jgi:large subunit ribosomal protein L23